MEADFSSDYSGFQIIHLGRLLGHNGSIFRIAWSADGSKLVSVSDDRRWVLFCALLCLFQSWCLLC